MNMALEFDPNDGPTAGSRAYTDKLPTHPDDISLASLCRQARATGNVTQALADSARHPCARVKCAQTHAAQHSTPIECQGDAAASTSGHRPRGVPLRSEVRISANILVGRAVGPKHPVPEEVNHGEVAVRMQMMGEVKLPLAPEPSKAFQTRSLDVIFLVDKDMRVERRRTGKRHHDK